MKTVALVSFIFIFGSWFVAALSPDERLLLDEVFDACGGVTRWSTFSTHSTFHRSVKRGGLIRSREEEDTFAQLQQKTGGNYAAYVKATRKDNSYVYHTPKFFRVDQEVLSLEIMQGGDFLLKVVEASDKYYALGSEWFKPSNANFKGRLPIGGEFADHVSLGVGQPVNLNKGSLESVEVVPGKEIDGVDARCIAANFKPHRRYEAKARSMTFCFSHEEGVPGTLMEVTERVDSMPDRLKDPGVSEMHSIAVRTYEKINMAVDFPFEPAPFSLPRDKRIRRDPESQEENPLLPSVSIRSVWVYLLGCGAGLVVLALVISLISYSEITSLWGVREGTEPLLGEAEDSPAGGRGSSLNDRPPLLV